MFSPQWYNRHIHNVQSEVILGPSTRIEFVVELVSRSLAIVVVVQVNGEKEKFAGVAELSYNFFRAIPMMHVNVNNRTAVAKLSFLLDGIECSSGDIVKDTETA